MNPLIRLIPRPLVKFFAKPYVAGDSVTSAMDVAAQIYEKNGFLTTLDLLAEDIDNQVVVQQNIATYLDMIDRVAEDPRFQSDGVRPTVSLKPSSYTTEPFESGGAARGSKDAILKICAHAGSRGVGVSVDMESRLWTDFTLESLQDLHANGPVDVGYVIQTRLHRSEADLDTLPAGVRVRLVIGIYKEPADVALMDKPEMKERMLRFAKILLDRGHFVEFATHDEWYVRRFLDEVVEPARIGTDRFEIQMLYGVPRQKLLAALVRQGVRVRLYVPFALGWGMAVAYLRRRLDEYPAMAILVLKNWIFRG